MLGCRSNASVPAEQTQRSWPALPRESDRPDKMRVSRRSALKGMAAGGVVAWTVPTILSSSAASAATIGHTCGTCAPDPCLDQTACGVDSTTQLNCFCTQEVGTGTCFCTQNVICGSTSSCASTADCPINSICQIGCCGTPQCFPLCA